MKESVRLDSFARGAGGPKGEAVVSASFLRGFPPDSVARSSVDAIDEGVSLAESFAKARAAG